VTDGRWKLTHHLFGDGERNRYEGTKLEGLAVLHAQIEGMPETSQAKRLREACRTPPEYELFDLERDPNELTNLYGDQKHAKVRKRLLETLAAWQESSADPFRDPSYVERFTAAYQRNYELWESLGGHKMRDKTALDFSEFIPPWDPSPYLGKKDQ